MNTKLGIIAMLLVAFLLPIKSQTKTNATKQTTNSAKQTTKPTTSGGWYENSFKDNWFISLGGGAQVLIGEDDRNGSLMNQITLSPSLTVGKYINPYLGFRVNFTGGSLHGYNDGIAGTYRKWNAGTKNYMGDGFVGTPGYPATSEGILSWDPQWNEMGFELGKDIIFDQNTGTYYWQGGANGQFYMQHIRYMAANVNFMVDVVGLIGGYNPDRKFDLTVSGGPTLFHTFSHLGNEFYNGLGANIAVQPKFKINDKWGLFVEGTLNMYPDDFDNHLGGTRSNDLVAQLNGGVTYRFRGEKWNLGGQPDYDLINRLNEQINDLRSRPCCPLIEPIKQTPRGIVTFTTPAKEETKIRKISGEAFIIFQVGKSILLPNLAENATELNKISKSIDYVKDEPEVKVDKITIAGYASPEGSEAANIKLSEARSKALKDYVKILYRFDEKTFIVKSNGENWDGLVAALAETTLSDNEKVSVTNIIKSTDNVVTRKAQLKSYSRGKPYQYLLTAIYPKLRRTDYMIEFTVPTFSLKRGQELMKKSKASMLSQYEMFQVANSYPKGSADYMHAIETALALYPEDPTANINAGAMAIERNELSRARTYLNKVKTEPAAYNNLGVLNMLEGNYDEAARYFNLAKQNGVADAAKNLEELEKARIDGEGFEKALDQYKRDLDAYQKAIGRGGFDTKNEE